MLEQLSEVQRHDLDLLALEDEMSRTPPELTQLRQQREALQNTLQNTRDKHSNLRQEINESELELKNLEARRKSAANSAIAAGNGKEASQFQNQELMFGTRIQELEEDTMPLLDRLTGLEEEIAKLEGEVAELEPKLEEIVEAENARVADLEEQISVLAGERDALARGIDASLLKQYEQVRRSKRGLGLVRVIDNQRCGGCNVRLPIHVVQKVRRGKGTTRCPSCGRILWAEDTP